MVNIKIFFLNYTKKAILFLLIASFVIFLSSYALSIKTKAQSNPKIVSGYAWSENIGWIDLQAQNGGINIDTGNNLVGYVWSENIGWIRFGGFTSSQFPSGPGTTAVNAKIVGTNIVGWARACAGMYDTATPNSSTPNNTCTGNTRSDGWDGWISLHGTNYGVTSSGDTFSGYAWGSDVLGWIDFSLVTNSSVAVSITSGSPQVLKNATTTIILYAPGADVCTIKRESTSYSGNGTDRFVDSGPITVPTTFYADCSNVSGNLPQAQVTVGVYTPPKKVTKFGADTEGISWETTGYDSCTVTETLPGGAVSTITLDTATAPSGSMAISSPIGTTFTLMCDATPDGSMGPVTTALPSYTASCSPTQNGSADKIYIGKKTKWNVTLSGGSGSISGYTWKGDGISTTLISAPSSLEKVYTTVGTKNIQIGTYVVGEPNPIYCSGSAKVQLDPGIGSGEQ